jgi:hypothetical protein
VAVSVLVNRESPASFRASGQLSAFGHRPLCLPLFAGSRKREQHQQDLVAAGFGYGLGFVGVRLELHANRTKIPFKSIALSSDLSDNLVSVLHQFFIDFL